MAVSDAARIEHHLNIETNVTKDHGGNIRVGDGSRCLAVYGKNIHAKGEVTIFAEKCKYGAKHQMWKHEKGALKSVEAAGKCLDIFENKCGNDQNLILWPCNGQQNQQFYFIGNKLKSTKCGNCVDVDMKSNIKNVLTWQCGPESKENQKMDWAAEWKGSLAEQEETAVEEADDAVVTSDAEELESNESYPVWQGTIAGYKGLCVDAYSPAGMAEGTREKGTNIVTWPCHGGANQQWKYENDQIINTRSGMCLDIFENKCKKDQNLILWKCNGQKNQKWKVEANGMIKSKKCGSYCVDIDLRSNSRHKDLYNLLLWSCKSTNDNVNQKWMVGGR